MCFVLLSTLMRCVRVCVQAVYSTMVDFSDIALWLFMMDAELNEKKHSKERGSKMVERWRRRDSCGLCVFLSVSEKETAELDSHLKTFPRSPLFPLHPAPPRSTSRPLSTPLAAPCLCSGQQINRKSCFGGLIMWLF